MNRYSFIPNAALALSMLIGLGGCDKSAPNKQETKVVVEQEAVAEAPTSDIFFYTSQHRADKYVPTEEKMGFGSHVQSINPSEFKDNKSLREVWVGPQIKHIAEGAFAGCSSLEKVHFQGEVAVINDEAFRDCSSLKNLRASMPSAVALRSKRLVSANTSGGFATEPLAIAANCGVCSWASPCRR